MSAMKKSLYAVTLAAAVFAAGGFAQPATSGWVSSYWDGCKPTCSWFQNLSSDPKFSKYGLSRSCGVDDLELPLGEIAEAKCAKEGGPAHSCWDQIPFADPDDPNLAYGFGATATAVCGQCFEVTFTGGYGPHEPMPMHKALAGKKAIIMGRNTGGVGSDQIDFLIPGGGLGDFDCLSQQLGLSKFPDVLGKVYGGLLGTCIDKAISQFSGNWSAPGLLEWVQNCHMQGCQTAFGGDPKFATLFEGCKFHVEWMHSAPNPLATVKVLDECPQILVDRYVPKSSKYTLLTKFIDFTSSTGNPNVNHSNKSINGVNSSVTLTYNNVNALVAGTYTLSFAIATTEKTTISVTVNGQSAGSVSNITTSGWSPFEVIKLGDVTLREGNNTVAFSFQTNSVNIDYFSLLGDDEVIRKATGATGIAANGGNRSTRRYAANVKLRPVAGGFTAALPPNHGYTSYKLIDLRGREIRRGKIETGAAELRFGNVNNGVALLRLEGKNASAVLRAATVR